VKDEAFKVRDQPTRFRTVTAPWVSRTHWTSRFASAPDIGFQHGFKQKRTPMDMQSTTTERGARRMNLSTPLPLTEERSAR
jgi:hypothetical protein